MNNENTSCDPAQPKCLDRYVLGEGYPFVIPEVAQLFTYDMGKAILVKLERPGHLMFMSGGVPKYRLVLERIY